MPEQTTRTAHLLSGVVIDHLSIGVYDIRQDQMRKMGRQMIARLHLPGKGLSGLKSR